MTDKLDVLVVTVNEYYYIPKFLRPLVQSDDFQIVGITTVPPSLGTENLLAFAYRLFRTFGPRVFANHCAFYSKYVLLDWVHRLGGGQEYSPKTLAAVNGIEYRHVKDINAEEYLQYARILEPDVIVSVAATQRFDSDLLDVPAEGAVNVHSSLLPEYQGVSPSFWALLNGEEITGVSAHYMIEEIDAGDLIRQRTIEIHPSDSLHSLNERAAEIGAEVLLAALGDIATDSVNREEFDTDEGNFYPMPTRSDVKAFLERGNTFY